MQLLYCFRDVSSMLHMILTMCTARHDEIDEIDEIEMPKLTFFGCDSNTTAAACDIEVLSLVVAGAGVGLVVSSPAGPVLGVGPGVGGVGVGDPQTPDFVAGEGNQGIGVPPFDRGGRVRGRR
jgi:hypothetical protein